MTRETRANLIFLVLFVLISIPGLLMLVKKKMDPTRRPMWMPDSVKRHMVYVDPTDAPESMPRLVPALTANWVADEARVRFGAARVPSQNDGTEPVMSDRRLAQLVWRQDEGQGMKLGLLIWNLPRGSSDVVFDLRAADGPAVIDSQDLQPLPPAVKRDIQDSGFPNPPQEVLWIGAHLARGGDSGPQDLSLRVEVNGRAFSDTLRIVER